MQLSTGIARTESDGTRWRTGGEVKGKYANGVGSQQSCTVSEDGLSSITTADAHASAVSSRLNWNPRRFKWTRPFRWKTKSGFCACAITFRTSSTVAKVKAKNFWHGSHILLHLYKITLTKCNIFRIQKFISINRSWTTYEMLLPSQRLERARCFYYIHIVVTKPIRFWFGL